MRPGESLLVIGALGAAIYFAATKSSKAEPSQPSSDCLKDAANRMATQLPKVMPPTLLAQLAGELRNGGHLQAADCLDRLAQGQNVDCASLLAGPIEEELRKIEDPLKLLTIANSLRAFSQVPGVNTIIQCLELRASQLAKR